MAGEAAGEAAGGSSAQREAAATGRGKTAGEAGSSPTSALRDLSLAQDAD